MIDIVAMSDAHLERAVALTQRLKWPHRLADWQQALALGEGLAAVEAGQLLGTLLFWRWGNYATLGLVIVAEEAQSKGLGRQLMQTAMAKLEGINLRLHATEMGKGLYEKLGFVTCGEIAQHQCRELADFTAVIPGKGQRLRPAHAEETPALTALDTQAHGLHRPALIASLLDCAERFIVLEEQGNVEGFACLRRFGHGYAIGPIICRSLPQAKVLVSELLSGLSGQFIRIDTDSEYGLGDWLNTLGLAQVDRPTTMVRGKAWQPEDVRAFGLMSQAMA
ncbi:GNAT family N-acetyltransferase [Pantoea sp. CCBC3-3-1]|uniref:GNAT family N-acetyltransferase n=1 Tax=Pantoea sp. CCBC3-3-1 TaxID=2490851 RepID=UPI0011BF33C6|nr:GNAT family N-acetyltransferase [Pantoea sp. CCBC3-3-1]